MFLQDRWREINEALQAEEAEGEIPGGHEPVSGTGETMSDVEGDKTTSQYEGTAAQKEADEVYIEMPSGMPAVPQEVEGISQALIEEYRERRLPMPRDE
jgi:hypothetical protein